MPSHGQGTKCNPWSSPMFSFGCCSLSLSLILFVMYRVPHNNRPWVVWSRILAAFHATELTQPRILSSAKLCIPSPFSLSLFAPAQRVIFRARRGGEEPSSLTTPTLIIDAAFTLCWKLLLENRIKISHKVGEMFRRKAETYLGTGTFQTAILWTWDNLLKYLAVWLTQ